MSGVPVRIPGTSPALYARWLSTIDNSPEPSTQRWEVTNGLGRVLGHLEYVGLRSVQDGRRVTCYGWRIAGSKCGPGRLLSQVEAARRLAVKAVAS